MKIYVIYGLVAALCYGLFSILGRLEIGLLSALVISLGSMGFSYLVVDISFKIWVNRSAKGSRVT